MRRRRRRVARRRRRWALATRRGVADEDDASPTPAGAMSQVFHGPRTDRVPQSTQNGTAASRRDGALRRAARRFERAENHVRFRGVPHERRPTVLKRSPRRHGGTPCSLRRWPRPAPATERTVAPAHDRVGATPERRSGAHRLPPGFHRQAGPSLSTRSTSSAAPACSPTPPPRESSRSRSADSCERMRPGSTSAGTRRPLNA